MFAVVLVVGAIAPAMAAKADAPGQNKVTICHFAEEENKYVQITIPPHAAEKHKAKHGDVDPVDGSCPIIDTTAPVITLTGADPIIIELNVDAYTEEGATATDDIDGDISASVVIGGDTVDESKLGTYVVTYEVSDSAGNAATPVTRTVNVIDTTVPAITLISSDPIDLTVGDDVIENESDEFNEHTEEIEHLELQIEDLEQENRELQEQIEDLEQKIEDLNILLREQLAVIYEWIMNR